MKLLKTYRFTTQLDLTSGTASDLYFVPDDPDIAGKSGIRCILDDNTVITHFLMHFTVSSLVGSVVFQGASLFDENPDYSTKAFINFQHYESISGVNVAWYGAASPANNASAAVIDGEQAVVMHGGNIQTAQGLAPTFAPWAGFRITTGATGGTMDDATLYCFG